MIHLNISSRHLHHFVFLLNSRRLSAVISKDHYFIPILHSLTTWGLWSLGHNTYLFSDPISILKLNQIIWFRVLFSTAFVCFCDKMLTKSSKGNQSICLDHTFRSLHFQSITMGNQDQTQTGTWSQSHRKILLGLMLSYTHWAGASYISKQPVQLPYMLIVQYCLENCLNWVSLLS